MFNNAIAADSKWREKLQELFNKYSNIVPFKNMGFSEDWQNDKFWSL